MGRYEKLLHKAKNNPSGLSFNDFRALMKSCGWLEDHQTGSHQIWYSPARYRISIQNRKGKAKGYQVKQFLIRYYDEVHKDEKERI
jgi:predicted RNA binding protein YcfA (HicA-like mRNA interferase family)